MNFFQKKEKEFLLFCPGPVNVRQNIKNAAVRRDIGHREVEFSNILQNVTKNLLKVLEIKKADKYTAVFITGSGTSANEAVLSSIVGKRRILVVSNGEFGQRLFDISSLHNKDNTYQLKFEWGEDIDLKRVEKAVKKHKADIIAMVHHETSMGMLNPIKAVGAIAHANKCTFFVDTVSSMGVDKIEVEKSHISFMTSSSTKALASLPGLAFVVGLKSEFEKIKKNQPKTMYLDLYKYYYYATNHLQTPNTPAVHLFMAFEQALLNVLEEGVAVRHQTLANRTLHLRKGMKAMGLNFLREKNVSSMLTTVVLPAHVDASQFFKRMKEKGIIIYNGKAEFKDKIFQVGNIGELTQADLNRFLTILKSVLETFAIDETRVEKQKISYRYKITTPSMMNPDLGQQPLVHSMQMKS